MNWHKLIHIKIELKYYLVIQLHKYKYESILSRSHQSTNVIPDPIHTLTLETQFVVQWPLMESFFKDLLATKEF